MNNMKITNILVKYVNIMCLNKVVIICFILLVMLLGNNFNKILILQ